MGNTQALGILLYSRYLFPFEVTSMVLLVAMVGAIVITKGRSRARPPTAGPATPGPATSGSTTPGPAALGSATPGSTTSGEMEGER
jgi:NADH-quinone oxidoreductase subunit J